MEYHVIKRKCKLREDDQLRFRTYNRKWVSAKKAGYVGKVYDSFMAMFVDGRRPDHGKNDI